MVFAASVHNLIHLLIVVIVLVGIFAVVMVVLRQSGIVIPAFAQQILWIVGVVLLAVVAIWFLASLL